MSKRKKSLAGIIDSWFPNCKEVTMLIVKDQEIKLSFLEKLKLYFHTYVVCKFCRAFRIQSGILHQHIHHAAGGATEFPAERQMTDEKKSVMQDVINAASKG